MFKHLAIFFFGAGVGAAGAYVYCKKQFEKEMEVESNKIREYYADKQSTESEETAEETDAEEDIPEKDEVLESDEEESFQEAIIKNSVLTESVEKPNLFDYAKISLNKKHDEPPVENSVDPTEEGSNPIEYKARKITVTEFEDLTYSYNMSDLTVYQDNYVTDYKDEVVFKLDEMYPNASANNDKDANGHIYVADDEATMVYDLTVVGVRYEDLYPEGNDE